MLDFFNPFLQILPENSGIPFQYNSNSAYYSGFAIAHGISNFKAAQLGENKAGGRKAGKKKSPFIETQKSEK